MEGDCKSGEDALQNMREQHKFDDVFCHCRDLRKRTGTLSLAR